MQVIMYLASGWHDGLRLLLEAGCPPTCAMNEALRADDLRALKIASGFPGWTLGSLWRFAYYSSHSSQQVLVDAIRKQRDGLLQLCYEHLTMAELAELGLPTLTPIDANIARAYKMLEAHGIREVDFRSIRDRPVYSACERFSRIEETAQAIALLEKLYAAGFRDIDGDAACARNMWMPWWSRSDRAECHWLMLTSLARKATSPLRSRVKHWPSALFDMAVVCGRLHRFKIRPNKHLEALVAALTNCCDATQRDACECFCSQGGCLPSRLFLTRKLRRGLEDSGAYRCCRDVRDLMLRNWCGLCLLDDMSTAIYFEDSVRLEVFDRLGMVHTCCEVRSRDHGHPDDLEARCAPDEERQQVQYEDAELCEQLELVMEAYHGHVQRHAGYFRGAMLEGWWPLLDEILPQPVDYKGRGWMLDDDDSDPDPELCDRRDAMQREALVRMGYGDLDFLEVIPRHFREYLDDEGDIISGNGKEE